MLALAALHALLSAIGGLYIHVWFDTNMAASVVVSGGVLLLLAWMFGPVDGVLWKWLRDEDHSQVEGEE